MAPLLPLVAFLALPSPSVEHACSRDEAVTASANCYQVKASNNWDPFLPDMEAVRRYEPYELCYGERLDPYFIWREVSDRAYAPEFLRHQITRLGSLDNLVKSMSCQGFSTEVRSPPLRDDPGTVFVVYFNFSVHQRDGRGLWRRPFLSLFPIHAHNIRLRVDRDGNVVRVEAGDTYH